LASLAFAHQETLLEHNTIRLSKARGGQPVRLDRFVPAYPLQAGATHPPETA